MGAELHGFGLSARVVASPARALISGDLAAFSRVSGLDLTSTENPHGPYGLRLARDRLLVIGALPDLPQGWHGEGFALSDLSAGLTVVELRGPGLADLFAKATTANPENPGPSAAITFAGVPVVLDRAGDALRLHVERGLLAYLWSWLAAAFQETAG